MKVLLMILHSSNLTGGAEGDFIRLLKHLKQLNNKFYIITVYPSGPLSDEIRIYSDESIEIINRIFPFTSFGLKKYMVYLYFSLKKAKVLLPFLIKNKKRIDVCFVNSSVCVTEILLLGILKIPYVLSIKEIIDPSSVRFILFKLFNITAKKIFVVSKMLKEQFIYVNKESNPLLIRSPIDVNYFNKTKNNLPKDNNENGNKFCIVNIGAVYENKNQILLIQAMNKCKTNCFYQVLFIGKILDYDYYEHLLNVIRSNKIRNVEFIFKGENSKEDVIKYLYYADCVVITSKREGMPTVLAEALFMEKPIITTNVGMVPEFIVDGYNGLIIKDDDPELLANCIDKLSGNDEIKEDIISRTFDTFKNNFSVDYYLRKHEEILLGIE